jgi:hypothetical protein
MSRKLIFGLSLALLLLASTRSHAGMVLTEWMYDSPNGEFMEFTNFSNDPIDLTNWSQDDSTNVPGKHAFGSTFGLVQPGESILVTEAPEASFRTAWNLAPSVKVLGGYTNDNLGRSDGINLYDNLNAVIDTLTYNDQGTGNVAGPRTQNVSGNIPIVGLNAHNASLAVASFVGDSYQSYASAGGSIGNPGLYTPFVPEPSSLFLLAIGTLVSTLRRQRRT